MKSIKKLTNKSLNLKSIFFFICLLIWSIIPFYRIFTVRFVDGHDFLLHIERIYALVESFKHGIILPRWLPQALYGYGSPLFSVYWGVPYYVGAVSKSLGLSYESTFKILLILPNVLSFFGMYLWVKLKWKNKFIAFVSATVFLWTPYRFLDTLIRNALGEIYALAFIPFVFYSLDYPFSSKNFILGSIAISLLIYSHQGLAFFTFLIIALYIGFQFLKNKNLPFFIARCKIIITGLLLSSFFWIPALFYEHFLSNYQKSISSLTFPPPISLIKSAWEGGYIDGVRLIMSYEVGLMHLLIFFFGIALLIFSIIRKRTSLLLLFWLCVVGISIFFMLPISRWFWFHIPFIGNLQFPFRLLFIPMLICPIITAIILKTINRSVIRILLGIMIILGVVIANRNHLGVLNKNIDLSYLSSYKGSFDVDGERTPYYMNIKQLESENKINLTKEFILVHGQGKFLSQVRHDFDSFAVLDMQTDGMLKIHREYFPGWNIEVDNKKVKPLDMRNGIFISLSPGQHEVKVFYKDPSLIIFANLISIFTAVFLCFQTVKLFHYRT